MISKSLLPISVIIPTYNYAKYLSRCISSITEQNYAVLEIIIIDDGSTDNTKVTAQSINEAAKNYNIQYFHQENSGVSSARNHGSKIATSEYLMFLDADDELLPDAFEILHAAINNYSHPDMIFGGYITYSHKNIKKNRIPEPLGSDRVENITKLLNGGMIGLRPSSAILKRTVMNEILFNEGVHIGEDTLFFAQVLYFKNCISIQKPLVKMRRHSDSLRENYHRMIETGTNGIQQVFSLLPNTDQMKSLYSKQILSCYLKIGRMAYLESHYDVACKYYKKAYKIQPAALFQWKHLSKALISTIKYTVHKLSFR